MIYVFISQNIRLPSSTQFPIFKIIKHMKYTYSSKIIHTSSNSSLQLSFTTFWENIFFHWSFMIFNRAYLDITDSYPAGLISMYNNTRDSKMTYLIHFVIFLRITQTLVPFYTQTIGESTAFLLTTGDE